MSDVYIGKVVNNHGIKGEIRILSDFLYKSKVFKVGNHLIIDGKSYEIKSYRVHKNYDMVCLDDYNNINDVLFLLKKNVYFKESDLTLDDNEILDSELMTYTVKCNDKVGKVVDVFFASSTNRILRVMLDKEYLIPMNSPMINSIDKKEKVVNITLIDGME